MTACLPSLIFCSRTVASGVNGFMGKLESDGGHLASRPMDGKITGKTMGPLLQSVTTWCVVS
eukprot:2998294-Pyramimonas_sp.AAC.1